MISDFKLLENREKNLNKRYKENEITTYAYEKEMENIKSEEIEIIQEREEIKKLKKLYYK